MLVTTSGSADDRSMRQFADELAKLKGRLDSLEAGIRSGQLGDSSIENDYLSIYDDNGIERNRIGLQEDGSFVGGNSRNNSTPPSIPAPPSVEAIFSGATITSKGPSSGKWPKDYSHINVYMAAPNDTGKVVGTIGGDPGVFVMSPLQIGLVYRFWLTSVNLSGAESAPSEERTAVPLAVVGSDILAGAVGELQLAADAVTAAKIAAGAVGTAEIAGQAVDLSKLADGSVSAAQLIDGSVQTEKIAAAAIVSDLIAANAVIAGKVAASAITTESLAAGAVSAEKIAAAAISAEKIAANAITAEKILALAITGDKIAANSISAGMIQAGSVTAAKLESDMVITKRIIAGTATGARTELHPTFGLQAYKADGTRTLWADASTGNITAIGTYQSGTSGERIYIYPDGTMQIFPATGTNYSAIRNDGTNILFHGLRDGSNRSGFLNMSQSGMSIGYGVVGTNQQTSGFSVTNASINSFSPYVKLRIDGRTNAPNGSRRVEFAQTNSSGTDLSASILNYYARGDDFAATFISPISGVGFVWAPGAIAVTQGDGYTHGPIVASRFDTPSSRTLKHKERAITWETSDGGVITPLHVVRQVEAVEWEYLGDAKGTRPEKPGVTYRARATDRFGNDRCDKDGRPVFVEREAEWEIPEPEPPKHYGPMAEDLQAMAPDLVNVDAKGLISTDIRDLVGVLWHALGDLANQVESISRRLPPPDEEADTN